MPKATPSQTERIQPAATAGSRRDGSPFANVLVALAAAGVLTSAGLYAFQRGEVVAPTMQFVPAFVRQQAPAVLPLLDTGALHVPAGTSHSVSFRVDDRRPCVLTGRVVGIAEGRRDVEVYVLNRDAVMDWSSGSTDRVLFRSGRTSAVGLRVRLPGPGAYHLLVSNRFSAVSDKTVQVDDARVTCG